MPWEKEIYVNMLVAFLKEEERRMKEQQAQRGKIQTYKFVNPGGAKTASSAVTAISEHKRLHLID